MQRPNIKVKKAGDDTFKKLSFAMSKRTCRYLRIAQNFDAGIVKGRNFNTENVYECAVFVHMEINFN